MNNFKITPEPDFRFLQSFDSEIYDVYLFPVIWLRLDRTTTITDPVYNSSSDKKYLPPLTVDIYTNRAPRQRTLTRFGFNTMRDLLVVFSDRVLDNLAASWVPPLVAYLLRPDIGDQIVLDNRVYEIAEVHAQGRWGNSDLRFHTACTASLVPPEGTVPNPNGPAAFKDQDEAPQDVYKVQS
jgi:hypothetical protein